MITTIKKPPQLQFSLRALFGITTVAAILTCVFVWLSREARRSSPDKPAYWVHQFHNGTAQERETAVSVIASYARKGNVNQPMIDALCEAATDKSVKNRLSAVLGLDRLAPKHKRAESVLQRLAKDDPDPDIRSMAQQALDVGINNSSP